MVVCLALNAVMRKKEEMGKFGVMAFVFPSNCYGWQFMSIHKFSHFHPSDTLPYPNMEVRVSSCVVLSCLLGFKHDIYHTTTHWVNKHFLICLSLLSVICCPPVLKWEERVNNWLKFLSFLEAAYLHNKPLYGRLCRPWIIFFPLKFLQINY